MPKFICGRRHSLEAAEGEVAALGRRDGGGDQRLVVVGGRGDGAVDVALGPEGGVGEGAVGQAGRGEAGQHLRAMRT